MKIKKIAMNQIFIIILTVFLSTTVGASFVHAFTFGAAGDYANGTNFHNNVNTIAANNLDFQMVLGDLAYSTVEASWCSYWKTAGVNNLMIVAGNHDSGESSAGNINTYVTNCPIMNTSVVGSYGKQYYWDYPAVNPIARFIMISPGLGGSFVGLDTNYRVGSQGYTFTANAVDDAHAKEMKWVIVGMHKNYISMMEKGNELGADLIPMLISKKVDLILQGHEHSYERSKQLTCAKVNSFDPTCVANNTDNLVKGAGTIIHVIGTGGQGLRSMNTSDSEVQYFKTYDITTYGFGKFNVTPTQLSFSFVRTGGGNFSDSYTISNTGVFPTTPPNPTALPVNPTTITKPTTIPTLVPSSLPTRIPTPIPPNTTIPQIPTNTPGTQPCTLNLTNSDTVTMTTGPIVAGNYAIWTRMMSQSDSANSYYLQIDSQCPFVVGDATGIQVNSWDWINFKEGNTLNKVLVSLNSGDHTLKLIKKEIGVKIDKILLLSNVLCIPTDFGENCNATVNTPIPTQPISSVTPIPMVTVFSTPQSTPVSSPIVPTTIRQSPVPINTNTPSSGHGDDDDDDNTTPAPIPTTKTNGPIELLPSHDATVKESNPTTNYKSSPVMEINGGSKKEVYIKFDLRNIQLSQIHTATLRLTVVHGSTATQNYYFINNTSWGERIITWNTRPNVSRQKIAETKAGSTGKLIEVDLSEFIKSRAGKVTSIVITQNGTDELQIDSKEASSGRPLLIIN